MAPYLSILGQLLGLSFATARSVNPGPAKMGAYEDHIYIPTKAYAREGTT
jgi:hypothetical protein